MTQTISKATEPTRLNTTHISDDLERVLEKLKLRVVSDKTQMARARTQITSERTLKANQYFAQSNIPKRHQRPNALQEKGVWADAKTKITTRVGTGFLIAIIGTHGCGKTQLAVETIRYACNLCKPALYTTATEFFMDIKATYRGDAKRTERDVLNAYRKPPLLVMDEVGKRSETAWEDNLLFELLDKRYGDCSDTLLIANLSKDAFDAAMGDSIISRLRETGGVIDCSGWPSFRQHSN